MLEHSSVINFCKLCHRHVKYNLNYDPGRKASLHTELASSRVGMQRDVSFHVYNNYLAGKEKVKSVYPFGKPGITTSHNEKAIDCIVTTELLHRNVTGVTLDKANLHLVKKGTKYFQENLVLKFQWFIDSAHRFLHKSQERWMSEQRGGKAAKRCMISTFITWVCNLSYMSQIFHIVPICNHHVKN